MFVAASRGFVDVVEFLIFKGADVNLADNDQWSPIYVSARNGFTLVVETLVACGANVEAKTSNGLLPLTSSIINHRVGCVRILLELGRDDTDSMMNSESSFVLSETTNEIRILLQQHNSKPVSTCCVRILCISFLKLT